MSLCCFMEVGVQKKSQELVCRHAYACECVRNFTTSLQQGYRASLQRKYKCYREGERESLEHLRVLSDLFDGVRLAREVTEEVGEVAEREQVQGDVLEDVRSLTLHGNLRAIPENNCNQRTITTRPTAFSHTSY